MPYPIERLANDNSFETLPSDETPFEIRCQQPSHLIIRLVTDDPELRDRAPMLLRRGDVAMPQGVLQYHLKYLGLPTTTDGQGRLSLVALEPGSYDVFHGKGTSPRNIAERHDVARLASVTLGANATVEIEVTLDFRLEKMDARLIMHEAQ